MCIGSQTGGALLPNGGAGWAGGSRKDPAHHYPLLFYQLNKVKLTLMNPAKFGAQMLQPGALYIAGPKSSR